MIRQVMPEFHSKDHIIILCDSWYTKQNLVSIVDEYPNLDLIGNARQATMNRKRSGLFVTIWCEAAKGLKCWSI